MFLTKQVNTKLIWKTSRTLNFGKKKKSLPATPKLKKPVDHKIFRKRLIPLFLTSLLSSIAIYFYVDFFKYDMYPLLLLDLKPVITKCKDINCTIEHMSKFTEKTNPTTTGFTLSVALFAVSQFKILDKYKKTSKNKNQLKLLRNLSSLIRKFMRVCVETMKMHSTLLFHMEAN